LLTLSGSRVDTCRNYRERSTTPDCVRIHDNIVVHGRGLTSPGLLGQRLAADWLDLEQVVSFWTRNRSLRRFSTTPISTRSSPRSTRVCAAWLPRGARP